MPIVPSHLGCDRDRIEAQGAHGARRRFCDNRRTPEMCLYRRQRRDTLRMEPRHAAQ